MPLKKIRNEPDTGPGLSGLNVTEYLHLPPGDSDAGQLVENAKWGLPPGPNKNTGTAFLLFLRLTEMFFGLLPAPVFTLPNFSFFGLTVNFSGTIVGVAVGVATMVGEAVGVAVAVGVGVEVAPVAVGVGRPDDVEVPVAVGVVVPVDSGVVPIRAA